MKYLKYIWVVPYSIWAYFMFFFLGFVSVFVYAAILTFNKKDPGNGMYRWNYLYDQIWCKLCGVKNYVYGREFFTNGQPYVVTCNHRATGDMFIVPDALHHVRYRPLGKIELTRMPILGYVFRNALLVVDRDNPESRHKSMAAMQEKIIRENLSILIFPEGTRNKTGKPLKDFYSGAFRLAIECQVPIIPMVILDTEKVTPDGSILVYPHDLTCYFLPPIDTKGLTMDDAQELEQKVFDMMYERIVDHHKRTA